MKKQTACFCITALIFSFITEPYPVSAAALPVQERLKAVENIADNKQEQPLTPEESEIPATPEEPIASETPEAPITEIPVRLTNSDAEEKTVTLEWDNINDSAEYAVFSFKDETWIEINRTLETTGTISLTEYGTESIFKICAYDSEQKQTGESVEIKVLIPAKVKSLKTTAYSKTKVKLCWETAKGADSYGIYEKQGEKKYKLVKTVKKTDARLNVKNKENYQFKIVPLFHSTLGTITGNAGQTSYKNIEFVSMDHQKYTYKEMCGDIQSLCKKYSEYVSLETIGYSKEGREIYDVILGNKEADKTILVVSTLHAREYIATVICMKQLEYYLLNYNKTVDGKNCQMYLPDAISIMS